MKLQQFDGGLSTRLAPQFLDASQAAVYENVDNSTGELTPVASALATAIDVEKYNTFFIKDQEWVSSAEPTTYLEYQNVLYSSDGVNRPMKRSDGVDNYLGIELPSAAPTISSSASAVPLETFSVQNDVTQGDLPRSQLAYRLYSIPTGESLLSVPVEFIVAETSVANPGLTNLDSIEVLEQVVATETVVTGVAAVANDSVLYGVAKLFPSSTYSGANTQPDSGARSVKVGSVVSLDNGKYSSAQLYRYYAGVWYLVHTFTSDSEEYLDVVYDISGNAELDEDSLSAFNGTYQYVYTYYNEADGTESAPSPITDELELYSGKVTVTMTASPDPQVTRQRIYRVGGERTLFAMVAETTALTYADNLIDSEMDGRLLASENYYAAPEGLDFISESYAMLFGAEDYTLYFTPIGVPNSWPPEYSIQFNAPITGIGPVANGVLVMTETQTFLVTGTGPLSLSMQTLRGDQGCISHHSIREVQQGSLVWASKDGLCTSSGSNVVNITKAALGALSLDPVNSAVVDEVYYLQLSSGKTLVWDYRFSTIFKYLDLGIESVTAAESEIYGWASNTLALLFQGDSKEVLKYLSPRFVEGSLTESKTYKKVYISHDGDIIIDIILNDETVASKALEGKGTTVVQVPSIAQRGYYIQFRAEGTGTINEISYTPSGQKDG